MSSIPGSLLTDARIGAGLVLAVAVAVRIVFAQLLPPLTQPDSREYIESGWRLFHGYGLDTGLLRTPGYQIFIASTFALLGESVWSIITAQHALGVGNALLTYVIGRKLLAPIAALTAGLLAAIEAPLLLYEHFIMSETIATTAVLLSTGSILWALSQPSGRRGLLTGLIIGLSAVCRPILLALVLIALTAAVVRLREAPRAASRFTVCLLAGALLIVSPIMVKNLMLHGTPSLTSTGRHLIFGMLSSGYRFHFEKPEGDGTAESPERAAVRESLIHQSSPRRGAPYRRAAGVLTDVYDGLRMSEAEGDRHLQALAVEAITRQPGLYALSVAARAFDIFVGAPIILAEEARPISPIAPVRELVESSRMAGDPISARWWLRLWSPSHLEAGLLVLFPAGLIRATQSKGGWRMVVVGATCLVPVLLSAAAGPELRYRYPQDPLVTIVAINGLVGVMAWTSLLVRRLTSIGSQEPPPSPYVS